MLVHSRRAQNRTILDDVADLDPAIEPWLHPDLSGCEAELQVQAVL